MQKQRREATVSRAAEIEPLFLKWLKPMSKADAPLIGSIELPFVMWSVARASEVDGCYVEIGTRQGKLSRLVVQELKELESHARYYGIDPDTKYCGRLKAISRDTGYDCSMLVGCSQDEEIISKISEPIAWLLVDGCHCYECVREDLDTWVPKVAPGGYVLVHDTRLASAYLKRVQCFRSGKEGRAQCSMAGIRDSRALNNLDEVAVIELWNFPGLRIYRKKG